MEIWIIMWMLQLEGSSRYQPRQLEVIGTRAICEKKIGQLERFYLENEVKYGNMYCTRKEQS